MEYQYNQAEWGPPWLWAFGFCVFVAGLVLTVWYIRMARAADRENDPSRRKRD